MKNTSKTLLIIAAAMLAVGQVVAGNNVLRLKSGLVKGEMITPAGKPLANAEFQIIDANGKQTVTTDQDGKFSLQAKGDAVIALNETPMWKVEAKDANTASTLKLIVDEELLAEPMQKRDDRDDDPGAAMAGGGAGAGGAAATTGVVGGGAIGTGAIVAGVAVAGTVAAVAIAQDDDDDGDGGSPFAGGID